MTPSQLRDGSIKHAVILSIFCESCSQYRRSTRIKNIHPNSYIFRPPTLVDQAKDSTGCRDDNVDLSYYMERSTISALKIGIKRRGSNILEAIYTAEKA